MPATVAYFALGLCALCARVDARPLVGAIRWDAWHGDASPVGQIAEATLGPAKWHYRLPFFAKIVAEDKVEIPGNTQQIMDQEIAYAHQAALDYWAFVTYPLDAAMSDGLKLYLASARKADLRFCLNLQGAWEGAGGLAAWPAKVGRYIQHFRDPQYQTVCGGRPLVFLFDPDSLLAPGRFATWDEARAAFDQLREAAVAAGLQRPYGVVQWFNPTSAKRAMEHLGMDAISSYATTGGHRAAPYSALAAYTEGWWEWAKRTGAKVVPIVSAGWDRRPRIERPIPWEPWQKPGEGIDLYYETPRPEELATHLATALRWCADNPTVAEANAILIYAWNEHDEGGWLVPTLAEGAARLDAIRKVLADES